jgi:hypothetical protein
MDTAACMVIAAATAMGTDDPATATDGLVTAMVVATMATRPAASMVVAEVVASTAVAVVTVVVDTGNPSGS